MILFFAVKLPASSYQCIASTSIKRSLENDSVDKKRDILITNQYPCEGRIMVIKTSLEKTLFKSVTPFSNESVDKRHIF